MTASLHVQMLQNFQNSSRIVSIDVARVLALIFMVQGHSLDVLLAPEYRQGAFFDTWLFFRGLTAPMFLMLAGFSFTIATTRRWQPCLQFSSTFRKRVSRFIIFILLGYAMHMPVRSLRDVSRLDAAGWQSWAQVDVLQCVGLSLLTLQLMVLIARKPARHAVLALGGALLIIFATPITWNMQSSNLPPGAAAYLHGYSGSLFPFFPWGAYVFGGAALGFVYLQKTQREAIRWIARTGLLLITAGLCLQVLNLVQYGNQDFWKTSPNLFLIRFGLICGMLAVIGRLTQFVSVPGHLLQAVAQESLVIYFLHICLLYGSSWNVGLRQLLGASLTPGPMIAFIALLLGSMIFVAFAWSWCKQAGPTLSRAVVCAMIAMPILR